VQLIHASTGNAGAGELSKAVSAFAAPPLMLLSLGSALLASLALSAWLSDEFSLLTSPLKDELSLSGAAHDPTVHATPDMLLSWMPLRSHLRHGLPDLSSARRPALIAPVLAFGPSLCVAMGATPPNGPFFVPSAVLSMVPSALHISVSIKRE